MIVKQEEWDALVNAENKLKEKYSSELEKKIKEIKDLQYEIISLKNSLKPDEIQICIFNYIVGNKYGYRETIQWQLDSGINLSSGIRKQVLGLLKNISNKLQSDYDSKLEEQKENMKENMNHQYDWFHTKLKTLPLIVSKKRIVKLFQHYPKK
jgi:hypothetical protein